MQAAFDQSALSVGAVFGVVLLTAILLFVLLHIVHALCFRYRVWRAKRRLEGNIAYAIRNDQGYWVGIWNDDKIADECLNRHGSKPRDGERVVTLLVLE